MSTILITHDLGLAAAYCDRVVVMEKGPRGRDRAVARISSPSPQHAYTKKLMRATPRLGVSLRDLLPEEEAAASLPAAHRCRTRQMTPADGVTEQAAAARRKAGQGISAPGRDRDAWQIVLAASRRSSPSMFRAVDGISFSRRPWRERRPGRRIRLRQVHHLDDGDAAAGPDLGPHHVRRRRDRRHPAECLRAAAAAQEHPDGVSGSDRQPQPALYRGARHRRSDHAAGRHQGPRRACAPAARNWPGWSACRSICSTVSRINCPAARRPASASRAPSRCIRSSSSSTSRPRRSTSRCRRWC